MPNLEASDLGTSITDIVQSALFKIPKRDASSRETSITAIVQAASCSLWNLIISA